MMYWVRVKRGILLTVKGHSLSAKFEVNGLHICGHRIFNCAMANRPMITIQSSESIILERAQLKVPFINIRADADGMHPS